MEKFKDKCCRWIADHLPRRLVYWVMIRAWAAVTCGEFSHAAFNRLTVNEIARGGAYDA